MQNILVKLVLIAMIVLPIASCVAEIDDGRGGYRGGGYHRDGGWHR